MYFTILSAAYTNTYALLTCASAEMVIKRRWFKKKTNMFSTAESLVYMTKRIFWYGFLLDHLINFFVRKFLICGKSFIDHVMSKLMNMMVLTVVTDKKILNKNI